MSATRHDVASNSVWEWNVYIDITYRILTAMLEKIEGRVKFNRGGLGFGIPVDDSNDAAHVEKQARTGKSLYQNLSTDLLVSGMGDGVFRECVKVGGSVRLLALILQSQV